MLLYNFMSLFSMGRNKENPYVKLLHSHAIVESLVSITLDSILKESCIIFVWGIFYELDDVVTAIYDLLLFNFMFIFYMDLNQINSSMKRLHSHAIESLGSRTLASVLKESCIRFVWGMFSDFYYVVTSIYDFLLCNFISILYSSLNRRNS